MVRETGKSVRRPSLLNWTAIFASLTLPCETLRLYKAALPQSHSSACISQTMPLPPRVGEAPFRQRSIQSWYRPRIWDFQTYAVAVIANDRLPTLLRRMRISLGDFLRCAKDGNQCVLAGAGPLNSGLSMFAAWLAAPTKVPR